MQRASHSPGIGETGTAKRSCENCSRAKAKCIWEGEVSGCCGRCFRLKRTCVVAPRQARRKRVERGVGTSTAKLEEKIESLVSLLSAAVKTDQPTPPESLDSRREPSPASIPQELELRFASQLVPTDDLPPWKPGPEKLNCTAAWITQDQIHPHGSETSPLDSRLPSQTPHSTISYMPGSHIEEGDCILDIFRSQMWPYFPFIIIPNVSARDLQKLKPWLYRAVTVVALYGDRERQLQSAKKLLMDVSEAILIRGERNIDMLQAMIIYNTWSHNYSHVVPSQQSTGIFQLTLGLFYDLGLNKQHHAEAQVGDMMANMSTKDILQRSEMNRTLDDRRALLCCYLLSTLFCLAVKKIDSLQFSPYMDHCCDRLLEAAEHDSDILLVALVRVQSIIEALHRDFTLNQAEPQRAPTWMHLKSVQSDLQKLWASLSPKLQSNPIMILCYQNAETYIYDHSLQKSLFPGLPTSCGNPHRLDMLHSCLISVKALLDSYLTLPLSYLAFPVLDLGQLGHGMSTLLKLSVLEEPGWDLTYVRHSANLSYYFEQIIMKFDTVGQNIKDLQPRPMKDNFSTGCARAMRRVKNWYEASIVTEPQTADHAMGEQDSLMSDGFMGGQFEYLNEAYWLELMTDGSIAFPGGQDTGNDSMLEDLMGNLDGRS